MSKYQYQDISELRSRMLAEIEQFFNCRNDTILRDTASYQEEQYSNCLDSVLDLVERETK
jgi:hypothetical protein